MRISLKLLGVVLCSNIFFVCYGQKDNHYLDSLLVAYHKMEKLPQADRDNYEYIATLLDICYEYTYIDLDSLLHYAEKTAHLSKKLGSAKGMAISASDIGFYHAMTGNSNKAITYYKRAIAIADSTQQHKRQATFYNFLGIEYHYLLDYEQALFHFLKGISYAEKEPDTAKIAEINENIALMYIDQEQYKDAQTIYNNILALYNAIDANEIHPESQVTIARIETELGLYSKAQKGITHSISYFKEHGPINWLAKAYEVKAIIYIKQSKYHEALPLLEKSKLLFEKSNDLFDINLSYNLALTYFGLKQYKSAEKQILKGLRELKNQSRRSLQEEKDHTGLLYKIYKQKGKIADALKYHESYLALSDSIHKKKNQTSLALYRTKMSFEKDKQLLINKNNKALAKQRNVLWTTVAILIVLLCMSIPLYFNHKKLERLLEKFRKNTQELKKSELQLSATNKTKDRLFSIIGHDLRGPIAALKELLKMMVNGEIEKNSFNLLLPKIKKDVDHILFTLNNLLSWGYAQRNGTQHNAKKMFIRNLAQQNVRLLSEMAHNKNIKITNAIDKKAVAFIDQHQIAVVFRNLISNAIKFTPNNGEIQLNAEAYNDFWKVQIKDNGVGMDSKTHKSIFQGNFTSSQFGTNNEKGTGLGLSLCKEMVEQNNGEIWVETKKDKGSCFYFTLPKPPQNSVTIH